jgi:hypothetical protein
MITNTIQLLNLYEYHGISENVDIAKGKYQIPHTWKGVWQMIKRRTWPKRKLK